MGDISMKTCDEFSVREDKDSDWEYEYDDTETEVEPSNLPSDCLLSCQHHYRHST